MICFIYVYEYMYITVYIYKDIFIYLVHPLKPTFLTYSSDGWVKRGLPYIHAKGILCVYIYLYSNSVISMLLGLVELNFNDSILGRMHSECIQNAFSAKTKNQEPRFPQDS